jgi:tetratricopeptide (TPR) repeat protein
VRARRVAGEQAWELVPPRCALDRSEDLEEVRKMIDAGEIEVARDELRWLLGGCSDFLDAHLLLGELALLDDDFSLARGHFGYAFQLGAKATRGAPPGAVFPYRLAANQPFFQAGKGLVWCLKQLDKTDLAREVAEQILKLDPTDPLAVRGMPDAGPPEAN